MSATNTTQAMRRLRTHPEHLLVVVPVVCAALVVAVQIVYPRTAGDGRAVAAQVAVTLFAAASVTHALAWRGLRAAAALVVVAGLGGLVVEAVGVTTGVPFGSYRYTGALGYEVLGVPWVIPVAWTMMAYPALLVGRRVAGRAATVPLWAGAALATWDLFLDPQMVAEGYWAFDAGPDAFRLVGIPVTNFLGWALVGVAMQVALHRLVPTDGRADDRVPIGLWLWTWVGSIVAHLVYLDLPASALAGGLGMGAVALPLLRRLAPVRWR